MPSSVAAMISDDVTVLGSTSGARLLLTGKEAIRLNTGFAWAGSAAVATSASATAASLWSPNIDCLREREKRGGEPHLQSSRDAMMTARGSSRDGAAWAGRGRAGG